MIRNVLVWLEEAAHRDPRHIAFEDDSSALTYGELLQRAQEIGSFLHLCTEPQTPVLIYMDKKPACIAAMLGAVYAGCFYTPVDPAMPQSRMARIVSVLKPACILCVPSSRPLVTDTTTASSSIKGAALRHTVRFGKEGLAITTSLQPRIVA